MLNASGTSAINGALDLTSGTLNLVSGTLTKGGAATEWIGGTISGAGAYSGGLTFTGGGARVLNGPTFNISNLLLPAGSLEVLGGALNLSGASQIAAGAELTLSGGSFSASGTLLNNGNLTKSTGGVTSLAALLTNNGNLNINAGTFSVAGGLAQTGGNISLASGATLRFPTGTSSTWTGGTLTQAALDSLVVLDNATLTLNSDITNTGTWQTQFTANLAGTGTLTNTGKLNLFANFLSGTPAVISANLVNQGVLETRDVIQINGAFSNAFGATLLNNDAAVTVANGFTNAGTIQLYSDLVEQPPSFTVTSGTLTNTGSIVTTGTVIQDQPLLAQIDNQGTITANIGRLVINKAGAAHVNTGTISANTANVLFQQSGGGTLTHAGGTITANPGRSITVTGGPMDWQGGTLAGTGTHAYSGGLTFGGSGARVLNGPTLSIVDLTLAGGSLQTQSGTLNLSGTTSVAPGSTITFSGGTHNLANGSVLSGGGGISYTGGTLNINSGASGTTIAAGTTLSAVSRTFGGTGALVNLGTLDLDTATVSGALDNQGVVDATGATTVIGAFGNSGTVNVDGGTLSLTSGLLQTGGGILNLANGTVTGGMEIQGGQLNASGASALNGLLNVSGGGGLNAVVGG
ncbi:MAG: hypothetical protein Q8L65_07295, partial [Burkholderiales bacterium]|nr:hypothetical protein [Burkholderiales bacterium]